MEQVKSALESTGDPCIPPATETEVPSTREGGGRIDLVRADSRSSSPIRRTSAGVSSGAGVGTKQLVVSDAGGGTDPWTVSIVTQSAPDGVTLTPGSATIVPGTTLDLTLSVSQAAPEGDATGFVELTRGTDVRRVPFWFHVETPQLAQGPVYDAPQGGPLPGRHGRQGVARQLVPLSRPRVSAPVWRRC